MRDRQSSRDEGYGTWLDDRAPEIALITDSKLRARAEAAVERAGEAAVRLQQAVEHFTLCRRSQPISNAARHLGAIAESVAVEGRKIAGIAAIEGRKYAGQAADEGLKKVGGLLEGWGKRLREEPPAPRHGREE